MEWFDQLRPVAGLAVLVALAWALSENRSQRPTFKWIAGALGLQAALALLIIRVPFVWAAMEYLNP